MDEITVDCHSEPYVEPSSITVEDGPIQEESALHCLPTEILETIIMYLDGSSAARLACTCTRLFNLVNEIAPWKKYVLHGDLKIHDLISLGLNFGTPLWRISSLKNHHTFNGYVPWKQIFFCHRMWSSIRKWDFSLPFKSSLTMDEMTSVNIAGQAIVFGTRKGGLGVWNPDKSSTIYAIFHTPVEVDKILIQLSPGCDKENFHRVIIHCIDTSLIIYDVSGHIIANGVSKKRDLRKILSRGDSLFEWDPDCGNNAITIIGEKTVERCSKLSYIHLPHGPFLAVDIIEQLFISQREGPLFVKYGQQNPISIGRSYRVEKLLPNTCNICISKAYIWPGQISFSINSGRTTIVSIGKNCKVIKWPPGFKCISASLFAKVLMIGTDVGRVLFYPFKDILDLLNLDPSSYEKELCIGTREPIVYVGVRVQNHIHQLPDVVAATRSKLFCFRATGFLE